MKASQFQIATLRENPQDAVIISHKLMMRAGLIRKLGSGLYNMLPMGLRSFRKVEAVVREELNRAGALEFILPILTPGEIWERSGRWNTMGKEMFRIQDRHQVWNVLGPTHEESFTDLVSGLVKSYKDLPLNVYQIHTKFRDEIRPRYGVMRSREFVMKDAYSFHMDEQSLDETYQLMRKTYRRIFNRLGLRTLPVQADSGTMGGSGSEEFMVPTEVGEETLLVSSTGSYRSNQEKTPVIYPDKKGTIPTGKPGKEVATPGKKTIEEVADLLKVAPTETLKVIVLKVEESGELVAVVLRGDRNLNEIKLSNAMGGATLIPAGETDLEKAGLVVGFISPDALGKMDHLFFDDSVLTRDSFIAGADKKDFHKSDYYPAGIKETRDLAQAVAGDPSPDGNGALESVKGIEVGHIFKLGDKYTSAFGMTVLDEKGKGITPTMGCYGIGVNRTVAAIIEQGSSEKGIVWPITAAPFEIVLVSIAKGEEELAKAGALYDSMLQKGMDILWDDRDQRPGVKFGDADLIGFPIRITMGKGFFEKGELEVLVQGEGEKRVLTGQVDELTDQIRAIRTGLFDALEKDMEEYTRLSGGDN